MIKQFCVVACCVATVSLAHAEDGVFNVRPIQSEPTFVPYLDLPIDLCASEYGRVVGSSPIPDAVQFARFNEGETFYLLKKQMEPQYAVYHSFVFDFRDGNMELARAFSIKFKSNGSREVAQLDIGFYADQFQQRTRAGYSQLEVLSNNVVIDDALFTSALCPASFRPLQTAFFDLQIYTEPAGALVYVQGELTDFQSNLSIRLPVQGSEISIILQKEGYVSEVISVTESSEINVILAPEPQ